jgi:hypothetical protein
MPASRTAVGLDVGDRLRQFCILDVSGFTRGSAPARSSASLWRSSIA